MTQYITNLNSDGPTTRGVITIMEDDGRVRSWTHESPEFNHILAAARLGLNLDAASVYRIPKDIVHLSSRVALDGERLLFDGFPVDGAIQETAERYNAEGRTLENLVNFMERLADNVTPNSRNELFKWLKKQELLIDPEGFVIGYRGLTAERVSSHSGGAFVETKLEDGTWGERTWVPGQVPNRVGTRISLNPDQVDFNTAVGCSRGLHVGSETYARAWADSSVTIVVRVDPADVAAVPDGEFDKMRVLAYEVIADDIDDGLDREPEALGNPDFNVPTPEETEALLDQAVPPAQRKKMSRTQRWLRRRNNDD